MSPPPPHIPFICTSPWPDIRREASKHLNRGGLPSLETAATFIAEAEFRNKIPATDQLPDHVWESLKHAAHPLAWLPPRRAPLEDGLPLWDRSADGTGGLSWPETKSRKPLPRGQSARLVAADFDAAMALAAFDSIRHKSNGRAEAMRFTLAEPAAPTRDLAEDIAGLFPPLAPPPPARAASADAYLIDPADAAINVLHIAINGGAYDEGLGAALGRLGAWRTLSFLANTDPAATFSEAHTAVEQSHWIDFAISHHPWFDDVAWDGCLAALDPARTGLSIVAWTDSD